ncbi:MAG: polysaccharide deacetylase family protein [Proteobacteria bacterium]|nr:polysaccharide deacetylase family protein [Pseudomonadota bacterium]
MNKTIGIKVDVDTYAGMKKGVPVLLALFKKYNINASFFVPMGKDHTGWTVKRVFTRKGFLKKAGRVGVISTYGIKTLLYGLLLPGPEIARKNIYLLHKIMEEGHELGIHGHDHVYWHDHIKCFSKEKTFEELQKAFNTYRDIVKKDPQSFAAPGWMINPYVLKFFEENNFVYTSNARGTSPFFPEMDKKTFRILEIPTTLPTLDEVVGIAGTEINTLAKFYLNALTDGLNILTVHTELEGKKWSHLLEMFIKKTLELGFTYKRIIDIANELKNNKNIPACETVYGYIEGRAGEVCLQQALPIAEKIS